MTENAQFFGQLEGQRVFQNLITIGSFDRIKSENEQNQIFDSSVQVFLKFDLVLLDFRENIVHGPTREGSPAVEQLVQ